jgi:hypothetical protein
LTELVNELAFPGGPRKSRVNQYFGLLLLPDGGVFPPLSVTDPDKIDGTLGRLRDVLGLNFQYQDFVNTVDDEQDLSNFRILSDYVTSLAQSWINNLDFFGLEPQKAFFGTQLVLLSRQLSVVAESVDEVRFTLDSVFLGPAERQTIMLPDLPDGPMFLEDLLSWVQNFSSEEGPRLIQDGGKFGVSNSVQPIAQRLKKLISATSNLSNGKPRQGIPPGFFQPRVAVALSVLDNQLGDLIKLAGGIQHQIPSVQTLPFELYAVSPNSVSLKSGIVTIQVFGQGFQVGDRKASRRPNVVPDVTVVSGGKTLNVAQRFFVSSNHLIVQLSTAGATSGSIYDVKVTNPDSKAATLTGGLTVTS